MQSVHHIDDVKPEYYPAKDRNSFERYALAAFGLFALLFAILIPPLQLNDEHGHFIRAYQISRGEFIGHQHSRVSSSLLSFIRRYPEAETFWRMSPRQVAADLLSREGSRSDVLQPIRDDPEHKYLQWAVLGANVYCPIVYLPASFGILIARALHFSPLGMMYLARIMNAALVFAAVSLALRFARSCPALTAAIALMPMTFTSGWRHIWRCSYNRDLASRFCARVTH